MARRENTGGKQPGSRSRRSTRTGQRGAASRNRHDTHQGSGRWASFGWGVLTGVFFSFLVYLGSLPDTHTPATTAVQPADTDAPRPRFDFYTVLPEQTIEPSSPAGGGKTTPENSAEATELYLLQAGSFRQREDADRRRAELLLLGLEPRVEEASSDNGRWYRVYVGPFKARAEMSRVRSLTANQGIDTLLLKRGKP